MAAPPRHPNMVKALAPSDHLNLLEDTAVHRTSGTRLGISLNRVPPLRGPIYENPSYRMLLTAINRVQEMRSQTNSQESFGMLWNELD